MSISVKLVQDRIHAINQTISGINAVRYFPQSENLSALFPFVFSLPERRVKSTNAPGAERNRSQRTYRLYLIVDSWGGGIPTQTGQTDAENLIDTLIDEYDARPRLDLNNDPLDGVLSSIMGDDTGIIAFGPNNELAAVQFTLIVTTARATAYK